MVQCTFDTGDTMPISTRWYTRAASEGYNKIGAKTDREHLSLSGSVPSSIMASEKKFKSAKKQQLSEYIRLEVAKAETLEEILSVMQVVTSENVEVFNTLKGFFISSPLCTKPLSSSSTVLLFIRQIAYKFFKMEVHRCSEKVQIAVYPTCVSAPQLFSTKGINCISILIVELTVFAVHHGLHYPSIQDCSRESWSHQQRQGDTT